MSTPRQRNKMLRDAVNSAKRDAPTTKAEVLSWLREHDKGTGKNVNVEAAMLYSGSTDKKSKEYKNAIRQLQGSKLHSVPRDQSKWAAIGKKLVPRGYELKNNSLTVVVKGEQERDSKSKRGGKRQRTIRVPFTGQAAYDFAKNPNYHDLWDMYGPMDFDEDEDGSYAIDVISVSAS